MEPIQDSAARERRQRFIAGQKEWLVKQGDEIGKLARERKDWASQARVIWEAARKETEPLVLLNLLRYQSVRNDNWEGVSGPLEATMTECIERSKVEGRDAALELIRHLLVYTIRSYTYHRELTKEKKGKSS
jgi:hypothetical protein